MSTLTKTLALVIVLFASTAAAQDRVAHEAFPRLRLGASAGVGVATSGLGVAASVRGGVQITRELAVSYQLSAVEATNEVIFSTHHDDWLSHALLVEYTFPWQALTIGVGPAFVSGSSVDSCGFNLSGGSCEPSSQPYSGVGLDARIALVLGSYGRNARGGFTLEIAMHATERDAVGTLGVGFDLY